MGSDVVGQGRNLLLGGLFVLAVVGFLCESPSFESRPSWTATGLEMTEPLEMRRLELQKRVRRASQQIRKPSPAQEDDSEQGEQFAIGVANLRGDTREKAEHRKRDRKEKEKEKPPKFSWSIQLGETAEEGEEVTPQQQEQYLAERSNMSLYVAERLHAWQASMSLTEKSGGDLRALAHVGLQALNTTAFLLNRAMFEVYDPVRRRSKLRYFLDLPARIDNDGTKDRLQRAKCIVRDDNSTVEKRVGVREVHGNSCLVRYMFPRQVLPLLPESDDTNATKRFTTCAVVGNSGRMLASEAGDEIDAHQAVIRFNSPPVEDYAVHVGRRTTFNFCNHFHAVQIAQLGGKAVASHDREEIRHYRAIGKAHRKSRDETLVLFESTLSRAYYKVYEAVFAKRPPPLTMVLAPDFVTAMSEIWAMLQHTLLQADARKGGGGGRNITLARLSNGICHAHDLALAGSNSTCARPLSGWYAILFALRVCQQVHVYGFNKDYQKNDPSQMYSYHYYDEAEGETGTHSFDLTMRLIQVIQQELPDQLFVH